MLAGFLDRVREAEDTAKLFDEVRAEKTRLSRRRPRSLVRRDLDPIGIASLPASITLSRGRMEVNFATVEELARAMYALARVLEAEGEEFAREFELAEENPRSPTDEVDEVFEALESLDAERLNFPDSARA